MKTIPVSRRSALALTGAVSLAGLLAACSSSSTSQSTDVLQKIKDAGKIRIGMEGTFKPWGYHNEKGCLLYTSPSPRDRG